MEPAMSPFYDVKMNMIDRSDGHRHGHSRTHKIELTRGQNLDMKAD